MAPNKEQPACLNNATIPFPTRIYITATLEYLWNPVFVKKKST